MTLGAVERGLCLRMMLREYFDGAAPSINGACRSFQSLPSGTPRLSHCAVCQLSALPDGSAAASPSPSQAVVVGASSPSSHAIVAHIAGSLSLSAASRSAATLVQVDSPSATPLQLPRVRSDFAADLHALDSMQKELAEHYGAPANKAAAFGGAASLLLTGTTTKHWLEQRICLVCSIVEAGLSGGELRELMATWARASTEEQRGVVIQTAVPESARHAASKCSKIRTSCFKCSEPNELCAQGANRCSFLAALSGVCFRCSRLIDSHKARLGGST